MSPVLHFRASKATAIQLYANKEKEMDVGESRRVEAEQRFDEITVSGELYISCRTTFKRNKS